MQEDAADRLNRAIRALALRHRARAGVLLAEIGLHPGQEFVLMALADAGPMIQSKIADAIACEPPSVTVMVRKLEESGHVERTPSPDDRRAIVVALTDSGRALIASIHRIWTELAEDTVAGLTDDESAGLEPLVARLVQNLDR